MCFGGGGCDFLARGGIPGHVPGHALLFSGSLINSVQAIPFSFLSLEAFSAGNALLFSGIRRIRYRRGPPTVRNMRAVLKKASSGTRRIFGSIRCKKQAFPVQDGYSVPETPFSGTGQARCPENRLVMHGAQFIKRRSVQGRASFFTEWVFRGLQ